MPGLSERSSQSKYLRRTVLCLGVVAIFLLLVWGRSFYGSMKAYQRGVAYLKTGEYIEALTYFDRSIHWYTPFNPYVHRSAERLWKMSQEAEDRGDMRLAVIAARTVRRGFYSARSFYTPGEKWIKKADVRIQDLVGVQRGGIENGKDSGEGISERAMLESQQVKDPDVLWSSLLLLGLLGWIGSVIVFIFKGIQKDGKWINATGLKWIGLGIGCFVLWIVGMMNA